MRSEHESGEDSALTQPPHDLTVDEAALAALAAEGRERQRLAVAAEEREARRTEFRERREALHAGRGYARRALTELPRGRALSLFPIASVLVIVGTLLLIFTDGRTSTAGLLMVIAAAGWFFAAREIRGRLQIPLERTWLRSLPFPVRGYFRVLSEAPEEERYLKLRLEFRDAAPDRETLDGMLGRVQYSASAKLSGGGGTRWSARSGPIHSYVGDDVDATNAEVLAWMRAVLEEALLPLHRVYPLRGVTFTG
jgi:hypothetical protein